MKSKSEIPNKTDFMKYSAFSFIENEKAHSERVNIPLSTTTLDFASQKQSDTLSKSHNDLSTANGKEMVEKSSSELRQQITDVRIEPGVFSPKRYVTTCYLKCYMQPFWYSETLFLTVGSSKKRHEEHVLFKNKLLPAQWSETMTTEIGDPTTKVCSANIEIPVNDAGYHYISLVPQQIAAGFKETVTA